MNRGETFVNVLYLRRFQKKTLCNYFVLYRTNIKIFLRFPPSNIQHKNPLGKYWDASANKILLVRHFHILEYTVRSQTYSTPFFVTLK